MAKKAFLWQNKDFYGKKKHFYGKIKILVLKKEFLH